MPKVASDPAVKHRASLPALFSAVPKAVVRVVSKSRTRSQASLARANPETTTSDSNSGTADSAASPPPSGPTTRSRSSASSATAVSSKPSKPSVPALPVPGASASSGSIPRPKPGTLQPRAQLNCARDRASVQPLQTGQSRRAPANVSSTKAAAKAPKIDLKNASVPKADVTKLPSVGGETNAHRSETSQARRSAKTSDYTVARWLRTVPIFRYPNISLAKLLKDGKNTKSGKAAAEAKIAQMKHFAADAGSMVAVDKDGEVLFAYFAHAIQDESTIGPRWATLAQFLNEEIDLKDIPRYPGPKGRTLDNVTKDTKYDGLQRGNLSRYHVVSQNLSSVLPPVCHARDQRNNGDVVMSYPEPGSPEEEEEIRIEEAHREGIEECPQKYERAGVTHLVHAWIQQGHLNGLLYPSRDMSRTSTGYLAVSNYYLETEATAKEVRDRFEAAYPRFFKKYSEAFAAGVTNVLDPGPFLGRALVWKMQVKVHQDGLDEGPAAAFPCGYYTGGYLYVPQLGLKLSYRPGDLAIFMAGHLYHAVDEWAPAAVPLDAGVTPGRVSSVFFFPKHSFSKLEGRPPFWNMRTLTGSLFKSRSSAGA